MPLLTKKLLRNFSFDKRALLTQSYTHENLFGLIVHKYGLVNPNIFKKNFIYGYFLDREHKAYNH